MIVGSLFSKNTSRIVSSNGTTSAQGLHKGIWCICMVWERGCGGAGPIFFITGALSLLWPQISLLQDIAGRLSSLSQQQFSSRLEQLPSLWEQLAALQEQVSLLPQQLFPHELLSSMWEQISLLVSTLFLWCNALYIIIYHGISL